jgi:hypothetical protein
MKNYIAIQRAGRFFVARTFGAVRLVGKAVAGPFTTFSRADVIAQEFNEIDRKDDSL